MDGVRKHCPEMILQFSTGKQNSLLISVALAQLSHFFFFVGNYAPTFEERAECLDLRPEMASLTCGSVNFRSSRPGTFLASHALYVC